MHSATPRAYRFDSFRVDLARRQLLARDGTPIALSSRAYDVLIHLIEHRTGVVGKDELMAAVWPRLVVEENNLSQAVSQLRRSLEDPRESARFIATIAGRGYRFVADVEVEFEGETAARTDQNSGNSNAALTAPPALPPATPADTNISSKGALSQPSRRHIIAGLTAASVAGLGAWLWSNRSTSPRSARSIAVLPFKPVNENNRNDALELGMADTLITRLSGLPDVIVAPLSSVRSIAGRTSDPLSAGRALDVDAVLDGYVQVQSDRVRLTARLLDVSNGTALWSGRFDERLSDFFAVQDALAQQVVTALEIELSPATRRRLNRRYTENVEAWQLYLKGRFHWGTRTEDGLRRAIEFYEAALALDPNLALAAAGLADSWAVLGVFDIVPPKQAFPQARASAQRALGIDPQLAEAQAALGHVMVQFDRNWAGGDRQYGIAVKLNPAYAQAHMWLANNACFQGRIPDALTKAQHAQSLEPLSVAFAANVAMIQYFARDFAGARARLEPLVEAMPQYPLARRHLARVVMMQNEPRVALALLKGHEAEHAPGAHSDVGRALALDDQRVPALAEVARVEALGNLGFGVGYDLALIWTALGERDNALNALERGVDDGSQVIGFLNSEPGLDAIRDDPRFLAVSNRLGLS